MTSSTLQPSFEDLGEHLSSVTFCVVDLETTGGARDARITEIGAVKVRGGQVIGDFQTLVRPDVAIPAMIQVMTGITDQMVSDAPGLPESIGAFDTFSAGCVMVAHNARFDMGFLRRAYEEVGLAWRSPVVIDTVALSRCVLLAGEVRNHKLATLAQHFHATTIPNHRALSDARATVDVLHGLLERAGSLAVSTLEDLRELLSRVSPARRAKRVWARSAPEEPGVYWFVHDGNDALGKPRREVLYVGKSNNLRRRVRDYFTAAEQRTRIHEMVQVATGVEFLACATALEAEVRELRMIASHRPRYNRRSKNQTSLHWLKLTREAFPRLSVVRQVLADGAQYWGPFARRDAAQEAALVLQSTFRIRACTTRLSSRRASSACALGEMGRCLAPCRLGEAAAAYPAAVQQVRDAWLHDARPVLHAARDRLARLVDQERFEEAGEMTDRLVSFHRVCTRFHRVRSIASCPEIVAAAPEGHGWAIHVIRYGRLAGAVRAATSRVRLAAAEARAAAATALPPVTGMPAGSFEEAERVASWLESPGVRLLETTGDWAWPLHAAVSPDGLPRELMGTTQRGPAPATASVDRDLLDDHRGGRTVAEIGLGGRDGIHD